MFVAVAVNPAVADPAVVAFTSMGVVLSTPRYPPAAWPDTIELPVVTLIDAGSPPPLTLYLTVCFGFVGTPNPSAVPGIVTYPEGHVSAPGAPFHAIETTITSPDTSPVGSVTVCVVDATVVVDAWLLR